MSTEQAAVRTTVAVEAWYQYAASGKEVVRNINEGKPPHRIVTDPDDPRWDDEMMKPPFDGQPSGALHCMEVTRLFEPGGPPEGEVVRRKPIEGGPCHKNRAREFLYTFRDLQAKGSKTPWDQERHYRDAKEAHALAASEGRREDMEVFAKLIREALTGPRAVVEPQKVSSGSPVVKAGEPTVDGTKDGKK